MQLQDISGRIGAQLFGVTRGRNRRGMVLLWLQPVICSVAAFSVGPESRHAHAAHDFRQLCSLTYMTTSINKNQQIGLRLRSAVLPQPALCLRLDRQAWREARRKQVRLYAVKDVNRHHGQTFRCRNWSSRALGYTGNDPRHRDRSSITPRCRPTHPCTELQNNVGLAEAVPAAPT